MCPTHTAGKVLESELEPRTSDAKASAFSTHNSSVHNGKSYEVKRKGKGGGCETVEERPQGPGKKFEFARGANACFKPHRVTWSDLCLWKFSLVLCEGWTDETQGRDGLTS